MISFKNIFFKGLLISGFVISFLAPSRLKGQTITNTSTPICPGTVYGYEFIPSNDCQPRGNMYCSGCDQNSVVADNNSISLVWLPGQSSYSVSVPTRCQPAGDPYANPILGDATAYVSAINLNTPNFICSTEQTTTYTATEKIVLDNDGGCAGPTPRMMVTVTNPNTNDPNFLASGYPLDLTKGDQDAQGNFTGWHIERNASHYAVFTAYWASNWHGSVIINLQYERRTCGGLFCSHCDARNEDITTFTWTKGVTPGGSLNGPDAVGFNSSISLTYQPDPSYPAKVQEIKYFLGGQQISDQNACNLNLGYIPTTPGPLSFTTKLLDQCGIWSDGPNKTVNVNPSCYQDNPANIKASISGTGMTAEPEGYLVKESTPYTVVVSGVSDFASNYSIDYGAGQADMTISGNTFSVNKAIGKYQIGFKKNTGRESCPDIPGVNVFLGGEDIILDDVKECPIILPNDLVTPENLARFGHEELSIENGSSVLNYFAAIVKSKRSITVLPGLTLDLGAELIIEQDPAPVQPKDMDLDNWNFVQSTSYDEYHRVISQSRNYFDQQGRLRQTQSKNISGGVMLANATLYDAYARKAVVTLTAPLYAAPVSKDACDNTSSKGDTHFSFSDDFIQATDGTQYNSSHFDIKNGDVIEDDPKQVLNTTPGTLGWYYSENNGTASAPDDPKNPDLSLMNEPFVAETSYPYSRTLWHRDGSGDPKGSTKPGDAFHAGVGHIASVNTSSVASNDGYLSAYLKMRHQGLNLPIPSSTDGQFFKSTATDENGRSSTTYTDKEGKTIISVYFGSGSVPITTSYQFYDLAGRLIASVSPNGVASYNDDNFNDIDKTRYYYNNRGLLIKTEEADAGITEYVYRKDGKIRFSQNAEQYKEDADKKNIGRYSYTNYDRSGRPIESGEYQPLGTTFKSDAMNSILENISDGGGLPTGEGTFSNQIFTIYDSPDPNPPFYRTQRFVHGAVSQTKNANVTSWYSYDEQGRVEWMVQNISGLGLKTLDYRYGPTGAVRQVTYQDGMPAEHFSHYYEYDADGRLFKAYTSRQPLTYTANGNLSNPPTDLQLQATYYYYVHGPLKRIEYANQLQGIDYTYTADGALKSINSFDPAKDPGQDGRPNSTNGFRPDVFGITLDYFDGDFASHGFKPTLTGSSVPDQFGGHIKTARWHGPVQPDKQLGYAYTYDDQYQFKNAAWGQAIGNQFIIDPTNAYQEAVTYNNGLSVDLNGNIKTLQRTSSTGTSVANFKYNYPANSNKLTSVTNGTDPFRTYQYDNIGQMTQQKDASENEMNVAYDVTGKVVSVTDKNSKLIATNQYDDRGFRLAKTSFKDDGTTPKDKTSYVRDASGNVIATYLNGVLTELPVYAAGKIGMYKPQFNLTFYELTDHLGTVRAVIGDELIVHYLATMEDERVSAGWELDFDNIKSISTASYINHTPAHVVNDDQTTTDIADPKKVIRINNGQDNPKKPVGGGIMLWVHPGDKISTEVFVKYANFDGSNTSAVTGIAGYLASAFAGAQTVIDGKNIFRGLDETPSGVFTPLNNVDDNLPRAFLSYLLFDKDMVPLAFDFDQVSTAAKIPATSPETHDHELLHLDNIEIQKEGWIYVYVSNVSDQNMDVYFDDLKVTHQYEDIVAGGDYYPFGLEISDRQITREEYRYKYQGKYAEKDDETGWSHFKLREYDPVVGRWIQYDPQGQFYSPYVGMSNNPVSGVDPDGGWVPGAGFWNNLFKSDERIWSERYAASWTSSVVNYNAVKEGTAWGVLATDKSAIGGAGFRAIKFQTHISINDDGSLGEMTSGFLNDVPGSFDFAATVKRFGAEARIEAMSTLGWAYAGEAAAPVVGAAFSFTTRGLVNGAKWLRYGGPTFSAFKAARGGTRTLMEISTSTGIQRISTEFHHVFFTQRAQRLYNLPNWLVNNRINVWKLNTVQHSILDPYRFNFLRAGFKPDVGLFGKYNWFTKF